MILFVNSCIRKESRTERIARALLNTLGEYEELKLTDMNLQALDEERLSRRTELTESGNYDDPMFDPAKQFAAADTIVIAAPYWDGAFPAVLRIYLENIYVTGIVSRYNEKGFPEGLCRAEKLYYVTTAGGMYFPEYSYNYLEALARSMFGIKGAQLLYADNLDIEGNDPDAIVSEAIKKYGLTE